MSSQKNLTGTKKKFSGTVPLRNHWRRLCVWCGGGEEGLSVGRAELTAAWSVSLLRVGSRGGGGPWYCGGIFSFKYQTRVEKSVHTHPGSASQFTSVYGMLFVSGEFLLLCKSLNSGVNSKFSSENQICLAGWSYKRKKTEIRKRTDN